MRNGVLNARPGASADAEATVSGAKGDLVGVLLKPAVASQLAAAGRIEIDGDATAFERSGAVLDEVDPTSGS